LSARSPARMRRPALSAGTYVLNCKIEQHGPDDFEAIVLAVPGADCPPGTKPESETRRQGTREAAFMACAAIGFAMEARLKKRGAVVRGWPPRGNRLG